MGGHIVGNGTRDADCAPGHARPTGIGFARNPRLFLLFSSSPVTLDTRQTCPVAAVDIAPTDRNGRTMPMSCMRAALVVAALTASQGCLVLSLNPVYDEDAIGWDPALVGSWRDAEDNVTLDIEADEWKSYRIHYVHPIETGDLTAYLTIVGDDRYVDLMPVRGKDHGSFLVPIHALLRLKLDGDSLEVTPLSYDWFADRARAHAKVPGLAYAFDQKENALIVSTSAALRSWLRRQPPHGPMFGAPAVFTRVKTLH